MLKLKPLVDRLVDDVLRAIGDATLAELGGGKRAPAAPHPAPRSRRRPKARRAAPPRPAGAHPTASGAFDPAEVDAITRPEELLSAPTAPAEPVVAPEEAPASTRTEKAPPPSHAQPVDHRTHKLRAGESVVRATAAGVVIRRSRNR